MSFIAGPYSWTFGSTAGPTGAVYSLGTIEDAPTLELNNEMDPIRGDNLGATMQDGIYRAGNCFIDFILQEYNAPATRYAFYPWVTNLGEIGCVGALLSSFADRLIGTPLSPLCTLGTEAAKTFTAFKAVLAPGFPVRLLMGSRLRNVPIRFQLLPFEHNSVKKFFVLDDPVTP